MRTPHVNQPDGPFVPVAHPAAAGREVELRALADEVRRLIALTVTHLAPPDATTELTERLRAVCDELEAHVPVEPLARHVGASDQRVPHATMVYDVVHGIYNPLALPVEMTHGPEGVSGHGRFTTPYEGPPGCVHGAVIAGVFDMVLSAASGLADAAGPTVRLTMTYRRPTLLDVETTFEGWVERIDDRRTHTLGRAVQRGEVTVEAEGVFARFTREQVERLRERGANGS